MTCPTPRVARVLVPLVSAALLGLSACQDAPLLPARTPATRSITVGAVPSTPLTVLTRHATPTTPELLGIDQAVITDFFRNGQVRSLLGGATPAVAYVRSDFPDTNVPLPPAVRAQLEAAVLAAGLTSVDQVQPGGIRIELGSLRPAPVSQPQWVAVGTLTVSISACRSPPQTTSVCVEFLSIGYQATRSAFGWKVEPYVTGVF